MKLTYKILVIFIFTTVALSAQRLGPVAGFQLTNTLAGVSNNYNEIQTSAYPGFAVGVQFDWDFAKRWGLDASVLYSMRGTNMLINETQNSVVRDPYWFKRQIYYLNVPLHVYFKLPVGKSYFSVFAGPSFDIGLHGKDIAYENNSLEKPLSSHTEIFGEDKRLGIFDFSLDAGVALEYRKFQLRASYSSSVLNIAEQGNFKYGLQKPNTGVSYYLQGEFRFTLSYLFDLRR